MNSIPIIYNNFDVYQRNTEIQFHEIFLYRNAKKPKTDRTLIKI